MARLVEDVVSRRNEDRGNHFMKVGVQRESKTKFRFNQLMTEILVQAAASYESLQRRYSEEEE